MLLNRYSLNHTTQRETRLCHAIMYFKATHFKNGKLCSIRGPNIVWSQFVHAKPLVLSLDKQIDAKLIEKKGFLYILIGKMT